ncbi:hypothetical protein H0H93_008471 [Arthromyces matolae]|nr:hypothetical protein H0H93_008471 [Arthromyces matolae]
MVSALTPFKPTLTRDYNTSLRGRFFGTGAASPVTRVALCQTNRNGRHPNLKHLLSDHKLQPTIHDTTVTVIDNGEPTTFFIFFKNHKCMPLNDQLGHGWRGDLFIMKMGAYQELVNMQSSDHGLATFAATQ